MKFYNNFKTLRFCTQLFLSDATLSRQQQTVSNTCFLKLRENRGNKSRFKIAKSSMIRLLKQVTQIKFYKKKTLGASRFKLQKFEIYNIVEFHRH